MMCVKNFIKESPIHGIGVYSGEFIPKGTIVWKFHPLVDRVYTEAEIESLPDDVSLFMKHYSYKTDEYTYVFCGDNGRFFNHSTSPSTIGVESDDEYGMTIASRDIHQGEELTSDYADTDDDFERKKTENPFR